MAITQGGSSATFTGASHIISTAQVKYGDTITVAPILVADNADCGFRGWFTPNISGIASTVENAPGTTMTMPDHNVNFHGTFNPNGFITRAEFAAIAARFDESGNTAQASFKDIYDHWANKEINTAAGNGWVLGYEDGVFKPDDFVTRAEAVTMVNRVLQRIPQSTADLLSDMTRWPDNQDTSEWYYMAIQEATNSHNYIRKNNGYEKWVALCEGRDWNTLENESFAIN